MNWIDIISIAPFYADLILQLADPNLDLRMLKILRLARSLRTPIDSIVPCMDV